ncbi:MAG: hypothetical protein LKK19_01380 [Bacteroidales bacterium]|nr:hypothetical protein [Bacteroidales bacterium]MCI2121339.1 hypothetical protein [Bacteroidales bacterium]MCI2145910.1 hypothetical protein [Bacteroidales bacterium]
MNNRLNTAKGFLIILLFALAHAVTCFLTHGTRLGDGIWLTILTIAMVFCLIRFYHSPFDVFLGLAFMAVFAGYFLGSSGARWMSCAKPGWGIWNNVIVTSVTTILLGTAVLLVVQKKKR